MTRRRLAVGLALFASMSIGSLFGPALVNAAPFDISSEPKGVLAPAVQQKLWTAYKTAKQCFEHPNYDPGTPETVATIGKAVLQAQNWSSPFPDVKGAPSCAGQPGALRPPLPISTVKLDEAYGEGQANVDIAATWFREMTTYYRYTHDPIAAKLLHDTILEWAKANGLGQGIHVTWGHKAVDYQMMTAIFAILNATAAIAPSFSADERGTIGPWLNSLVKQSAAGYWKDREDDKAFMKAYIAMVWGLMVGDDKAVQSGIEVYKLAIHDMRPDGSWPIDTQRSGMGLDYDSVATAHLAMMAVTLKEARGLDLIDYSVDGRSIKNAVDFVMAGIADPSLNQKYAIPCASGGDRWGSITSPSLAYTRNNIGYLIAYAQTFPDEDVSKKIMARFASDKASEEEEVGGAPACLYASIGGSESLPPLTMPLPAPVLPKMSLALDAKEEFSTETGHSDKINSLIVANIEHAAKGQNEIRFNVVGYYDFDSKQPLFLSFIPSENLGKTMPKGLVACKTQTVTWDDGGIRAVIDLTVKGNVVSDGPTTACTLKALPTAAASDASFALQHFRDVAISMVSSGAADDAKSDAIKALLHQIAEGGVQMATN